MKSVRVCIKFISSNADMRLSRSVGSVVGLSIAAIDVDALDDVADASCKGEEVAEVTVSDLKSRRGGGTWR